MRIKGIDFLRGIAILLVIGRHLGEIPNSLNNYSSTILKSWKLIGWIGVDLFFVLSGFLISSIIFNKIKSNNFSVTDFYKKRFIKIYPLFLIVLILPVFFLNNVPIKSILSELFFMQGYITGLWQHTWSLCVEEQFYIIFPLIVLLLVKANAFKKLPYILIVMCALVILMRGLSYTGAPLFTQTHLRIDTILWGVFIAYFYLNYNSYFDMLFRYKNGIKVGALLLLGIAFILFIKSPFVFQIIGFNFMAIGFSVFLLLSIKMENIKNGFLDKLFNMISYIGTCSYSVYLVHIPLNLLILSFSFSKTEFYNYYIANSIYIVCSILVGILINKFIEQPILKLRNKYIL